jgi:hypothetical protein
MSGKPRSAANLADMTSAAEVELVQKLAQDGQWLVLMRVIMRALFFVPPNARRSFSMFAKHCKMQQNMPSPMISQVLCEINHSRP